MARALERTPLGYDPDTLKTMRQAFDDIWQEIAGNYGSGRMIEERRARLARIVVGPVDQDIRELARLKDMALRQMLRSELPLPLTRF
jgi:hypothetical protein